MDKALVFNFRIFAWGLATSMLGNRSRFRVLTNKIEPVFRDLPHFWPFVACMTIAHVF